MIKVNLLTGELELSLIHISKVEFVEVSVEDALAEVEADRFSSELIKENAKDGKVAMYQLGDVKAVADDDILLYGDVVKNLRLLSVAGAYWKDVYKRQT